MDSGSEGLGRRGHESIEVLSSEPKLCLYHNFLSMEECEHLINLGKPHMKRSLLYDPENPGSDVGKISSGRTSTGAFLKTKAEDEVTRDIEKRISDCTSIPLENGEGLQILHYEVGQEVIIHQDYHSDERKNRIGSQRNITVLMYLSNVEEGGETFFPRAKMANLDIISSNVLSTDKGIYVKPKMCDALMFWNLKPDGKVDPLTMHGSAPVIKGDKWACTMWMHDARYQRVATSSTSSPRPLISRKRIRNSSNNLSLVQLSDKSNPLMPRRSPRTPKPNMKYVQN